MHLTDTMPGSGGPQTDTQHSGPAYEAPPPAPHSCPNSPPPAASPGPCPDSGPEVGFAEGPPSVQVRVAVV